MERGAARTENGDKSPLSCRSVVRLPAVTSPLFTPILRSSLRAGPPPVGFISPLRCPLYEERSLFFSPRLNVDTEISGIAWEKPAVIPNRSHTCPRHNRTLEGRVEIFYDLVPTDFTKYIIYKQR